MSPCLYFTIFNLNEGKFIEFEEYKKDFIKNKKNKSFTENSYEISKTVNNI